MRISDWSSDVCSSDLLSGFFGSQRVYQGKPGSYHSGTDVAVPAGTPFVAPADGVVVLAASAPFTLEGNLLIVDHGMGLNSAFLHCQRLDRSEEHTSELQSLMRISYAVFCLKNKKQYKTHNY